MELQTFVSDLSQHNFPLSERVVGKVLPHPMLAFIQKQYPDFTAEHSLSVTELSYYREKYLAEYLAKEVGEISSLEETVLNSLKNKSIVSENDAQDALTFGQKIADKVATFGGSWYFIISFGVFIAIWILSNVLILMQRAFDPYPFILLNLILSCIAALQAPVIMMSQNRQEEKDRDRAKQDYLVNLKSELEIRILHEKIDHLILHQNQEMLDMLQTHAKILEELLAYKKQEMAK
ncbi:MAG: DUF1003 domain-containing protein [Bacteroidetes bacterium]|nr:MAG: DUF1003 domain-containing protein [Bacteroidota bacterium]